MQEPLTPIPSPKASPLRTRIRATTPDVQPLREGWLRIAEGRQVAAVLPVPKVS